MSCRNLILVLGDQLDHSSSALRGFDARRDRVWMAELPEESTHVWSHKARIVLFLSAMRHFRDELQTKGYPIDYLELGTHPYRGFGEALRAELAELKPERLILAQPGDYRVLVTIREVAKKASVPLEIREDAHFLLPLSEFDDWAVKRPFIAETWLGRREWRAA